MLGETLLKCIPQKDSPSNGISHWENKPTTLQQIKVIYLTLYYIYTVYITYYIIYICVCAMVKTLLIWFLVIHPILEFPKKEHNDILTMF